MPLDNIYKIHITKRTSGLWRLWLFWFPKADLSRMYLAFGRTIFTPGEGCPMDLQVHESIHLKQQKFSYTYAVWWHLKYRISSSFRYSQELEAYKAQMRWAERQKWDYKKLYSYRRGLSELLAHPMYGSLVTETEAFEVLGQEKK